MLHGEAAGVQGCGWDFVCTQGLSTGALMFCVTISPSCKGENRKLFQCPKPGAIFEVLSLPLDLFMGGDDTGHSEVL